MTEQNYDGKPMDCTIPDISTVTDDGKSYAIPSIVNWSGKPNTWSGSYQENATLTAKICGYGSSDMGCVSSLANSLIYYAAANKVDSKSATDAAGYQSRTAGETDSSSWVHRLCIWQRNCWIVSGMQTVMTSVCLQKKPTAA